MEVGGSNCNLNYYFILFCQFLLVAESGGLPCAPLIPSLDLSEISVITDNGVFIC